MKTRYFALVMALVTSLVLGLTGAALAEDGKGEKEHKRGFRAAAEFHDMEQAAWASKFVTMMQVKEVIKGYADRTFRPQQPVNRQEAVAMVVRALGYEPQAQQVTVNVYGSVYGATLPYSDAARIDAWARGNVRVALDKGLLDASEPRFMPHQPAVRAWVVPILVRALGLEADARANASAQLPFADANAIPVGAIGYIKVALDLGLVSGYAEDNTFRPMRPVTRAEMAKLLDVVQAELNKTQTQAFEAAGVVKAVSGSSITLATAGGQSAVYEVAYNAHVFVAGQPAAVADIKAGMRAHLFLNAQGQAVFVEALQGGKRPGLLRRHHPKEREFAGTVEAVDAAALSLTVKVRGAASVTLDVAEDAEIEMDGPDYTTLADIQVGDRVKVKVRQGVAVSIEVKGEDDERENEVKGRLVAVDPVAGTVTVASAVYGGDATYDVAVDTVIKIEGLGAATLADLKAGDFVSLKLVGDVVVKLEAKGRKEAKEREKKERLKDRRGDRKDNRGDVEEN